MEQTAIRLRRENLKRELALLQTSLKRQFNLPSLMRMTARGETRARLSEAFLAKVGARATKAEALGTMVGEMIRRSELDVEEVETLLTVVAVNVPFHGAMDGALAALEERAQGSRLHCWEALNAVERLLDDVLVKQSDLREQVAESQSELVKMAGLPR